MLYTQYLYILPRLASSRITSFGISILCPLTLIRGYDAEDFLELQNSNDQDLTLDDFFFLISEEMGPSIS